MHVSKNLDGLLYLHLNKRLEMINIKPEKLMLFYVFMLRDEAHCSFCESYFLISKFDDNLIAIPCRDTIILLMLWS